MWAWLNAFAEFLLGWTVCCDTKVKIFHEKGPDFRTFSLSIADYLFSLPTSTDDVYTLVPIKAAA